MRFNLGSATVWRPWPVYLLAASLPFTLAGANAAKLLLLLVGVVLLIQAFLGRRSISVLTDFSSAKWVLVMLFALGLSLSYTSAPLLLALEVWKKYARLLAFILVLMVIYRHREARTAVAVLLVSQTLVLLTTGLMRLGWAVPWVPAGHFPAQNFGYAAYSSYLDQAIMTAGYAATCWHLRDTFQPKWCKPLLCALSLLALMTVVFILPGRSGQVAMLAACLLGVFWLLRDQRRAYWMAAPVLFAAMLVAVPSTLRDRMSLVASEAKAYNEGQVAETSTGNRLTFWKYAGLAILEKPVIGFGVGGFDHAYRQVQSQVQHQVQSHAQSNSTASHSNAQGVHNAHQEYLQWGVQLGVGGIALFLALLAWMLRDTKNFSTPYRRAAQSQILVFAVACLFNSSLLDAMIGDYFCLSIALLLALGATESDQPPTAAAPA